MQNEWDSEISFWIKGVPYLWVAGETLYDSKRFYLLGNRTDELSFFDEKNEIINYSCFKDAKNVCLFPIDLKAKIVRNCLEVFRWYAHGWKNIISVEEALEVVPYKNASLRIEGKSIDILPPIEIQYGVTILSEEYEKILFLYELSFSNVGKYYDVFPDTTKTKSKIVKEARKKNEIYKISECTAIYKAKDFHSLPHVKKFYKLDYIHSLYNQISKNYEVEIKNKTFLEKLFEKNMVDKSEICIPLFINFLNSLKKKTFLEGERGEKKAKEVLDMVPKNKLNKNSVVLDFGAGDGAIIAEVSKILKLNKKNAIAVDLKKMPDNEFYTYLSDVKNVPDNSIDCIILFEVLHHINPEYHESIIKELKRCLKSHGIIVVKEHDFPNHEEDPFYLLFLNLIHEMWYVYKNEERDQLWSVTNSITHISELMFPLKCVKTNMWTQNNYQRIYRASFSFENKAGLDASHKDSRKAPIINVPHIKDQPLPNQRVNGSYKKIDGKFVFVEFKF